jgi:hypothetical protein
MCNNSQSDCVFIEAFCRCRATDPTAVLQASVFGYGNLSSGRASGEEFTHTCRKALHILLIQLRPSRFLTLSSSGPGLGVGQTFSFGSLQCLRLHQKSLSLIAFSGTSPFQYHCSQGRVFTCAPGKGCIAGRKKDKMIQVGTRKAQGSFVFDQCNPRLAAKVFATFVTGRITSGDEHLQVSSLFSTPHLLIYFALFCHHEPDLKGVLGY